MRRAKSALVIMLVLITGACGSSITASTTTSSPGATTSGPGNPQFTLPIPAIAPVEQPVPAVTTPFCVGLADAEDLLNLPSALAFLLDAEIGDEARETLRRAASSLEELSSDVPSGLAESLDGAVAALNSLAADDEPTEDEMEDVAAALEVLGAEAQDECGFSSAG